ncbi:POP1-domain-containing protein [Schizopora paradoxa]|uniref:POP1-domain-containing protein n=1 Tax=Schizopora paradoxa TaxID=27342 RepID=A0A0H2RS24_9AGAM|nr:POP1-domain-containing protein [Schizopora paradoxa]
MLGMEGLPSSIDVEKFVEARAYEVGAMQEAMEKASEASSSRVWQSLPRHFRRRAASHDVRRVPARLREKARAEMDPPKKQARKRVPQMGKSKQISRTEDFLLRQKDKTWLETHIWHAKRMKMENMWGYRLAVQPTEKSFRPSHRASLHGSILHDCSYNAIIELTGTERTLKMVLDRCCDAQEPSPAAARYVSGSRICLTYIYGLDAYPLDFIAPINIMWKPKLDESTGEGKGKGKAAPSKVHERTLWIRCHPLSYERVTEVLRTSISTVLQSLRDKVGETLEVDMSDFRDRFNIYEIIGPKSSQVIMGALSPIKDELKDNFKKTWQALGQLRSPGSVPRGTIIGFTVYDPRLNFPPKNITISNDSQHDPSAIWPSASLASCDIWDEVKRNKLQKPHFKKKDIDERKSKNLVPGSSLNPMRQDDRVPVMLIQKTIASPKDDDDTLRSLHGWTVIIPKGWGMPFFSSLIHTGTRVGGQREKATQHFEAGSLYFPRDYPGSTTYDDFVTQRGKEEKERWERKPPAKRPSWEKLGTRSPWTPDWDVVLGLRESTTIVVDSDEGLVPAQREAEVEAPNDVNLRPWLLKGPDVSSFPGNLMKTALLMVMLHIPRSGSPEDDALIYELENDEAKRWKEMLDQPIDSVRETELSEIDTSQAAIIGYVTSGNFSLSIGQGHAVGAIPVTKYLQLVEQSYRLGFGGSRPLIKWRNKDGNICRVAELEILC